MSVTTFGPHTSRVYRAISTFLLLILIYLVSVIPHLAQSFVECHFYLYLQKKKEILFPE